VNISSTKIRAALNEGKIEVANQYLGYDFALSGKVVHGRKIGKELGFPTANVVVEDAHKIIPCQGVYAVEVDVDKSSYGGMLNIGWNPTVSENQQRKIEVHIFDFDGDLYDHKIRIRFKKRIRDEQKFDSLLELKNQLKADRAKAWEILH
jgi:riboflavin kinase/FMN adenylyltransferase